MSREDVDNFVRADNRFGERFFERNGPRLVYRDRYMMKRYRSSGGFTAQRIIDADFRCVGVGDNKNRQQARQRHQHAPPERRWPGAFRPVALPSCPSGRHKSLPVPASRPWNIRSPPRSGWVEWLRRELLTRRDVRAILVKTLSPSHKSNWTDPLINLFSLIIGYHFPEAG